MSFDPDYDYKGGLHTKVRAVGQLWVGPLKKDGYDNRVLKITASDVEFKNSVEADRFLAYQQKKLTTPSKYACSARKTRMASMKSD